MENLKAARMRGIDALRGISALLVLAQHIVPLSWIGEGNFLVIDSLYLIPGRVGVAAFFLISGYIIPSSMGPRSTLSTFWISRFFRLWPLYIVVILLAVVMGAEKTEELNAAEVLLNFTMLQQFIGVPNALGVFWTLQIELVFYFLVSGMLLLGVVHDRNAVRTALALSTVLALLMAAARFATGIKLPVALPIGLMLMFFGAELRLARLSNESLPLRRIAVLLVSLVGVCLLGYSYGAGDNPYRWATAYTLAVVLFLFFERAKTAPAALVFLGTISYSVYLLHPLVISFFGNEEAISAVWIVSCTLAAATASYYFIEKPFQKLGKRLSSNAAAAQAGAGPAQPAPELLPLPARR
jgi:peptidoglycan/LPS O-acetylase OafA/YrhL